jgi:PAP2 superfamily protein
MFFSLTPMTFRWLSIGCVALIDAALMYRSGIGVSMAMLRGYGEVGGAWALLTFFYNGVTRHNPRLATFTMMVMQASLFSFVAAAFSYLVLTLRAPLMDQEFSALDQSLGFDWLAWATWIYRHPRLNQILILAYESMAPQFFLALALFPLLGKQRYVSELCSAAVVALLIVIPVSGAIPALGPWVYYEVGIKETIWLPDVLALRDGTMTVLGEHAFSGIVCCPSFHTALAILFVYAARWNRGLLLTVGALNGLLLLSVPSVGNHYLIDVIAGLLVAGVAIAAAGWVESRTAAPPAARQIFATPLGEAR